MAVGETQLRIHALGRDECEQILARNHIGRLAHTHGKRVDVKPVHYVYAEGWIYGRGPFAEVYGLVARNGYQWQPVAFEVEEIDDLFNWRYVVVQGGFYVIDRERSFAEAQIWQHAVELLRSLEPDALRANDLAPDRTVLCRIAVQDVSGEAAASDEVGKVPAEFPR